MEGKNIVAKIALAILIILIIIVIVFAIYIVQNREHEKVQIEDIFGKVEMLEAELTEYIVYGTHLNIKGEIKEKEENIEGVNLILTGANENESITELNYEETETGINFYTSNLINEGVDLEKVSIRKTFCNY